MLQCCLDITQLFVDLVITLARKEQGSSELTVL